MTLDSALWLLIGVLVGVNAVARLRLAYWRAVIRRERRLATEANRRGRMDTDPPVTPPSTRSAP